MGSVTDILNKSVEDNLASGNDLSSALTTSTKLKPDTMSGSFAVLESIASNRKSSESTTTTVSEMKMVAVEIVPDLANPTAGGGSLSTDAMGSLTNKLKLPSSVDETTALQKAQEALIATKDSALNVESLGSLQEAVAVNDLNTELMSMGVATELPTEPASLTLDGLVNSVIQNVSDIPAIDAMRDTYNNVISKVNGLATPCPDVTAALSNAYNTFANSDVVNGVKKFFNGACDIEHKGGVDLNGLDVGSFVACIGSGFGLVTAIDKAQLLDKAVKLGSIRSLDTALSYVTGGAVSNTTAAAYGVINNVTGGLDLVANNTLATSVLTKLGVDKSRLFDLRNQEHDLNSNITHKLNEPIHDVSKLGEDAARASKIADWSLGHTAGGLIANFPRNL